MHQLSLVLKDRADSKREKAENKLKEWTLVIDEMTDSIEIWDKETEEGVELIEATEHKQVCVHHNINLCGSTSDPPTPFDYLLISIFDWLLLFRL